eukprot:COSAG02_NODE_39757_length_413_cov_0.824841_2_plen_64_part_01
MALVCARVGDRAADAFLFIDVFLLLLSFFRFLLLLSFFLSSSCCCWRRVMTGVRDVDRATAISP